MAVMTVPARGTAAGLPERLRVETRHCHEKVEAATDIPGRVRTREDYAGLLSIFGELHGGLETQLSAPTWDRAWVGVGVDIAAHRRATILLDDLDGLGVPATSFPALPAFRCFGQAMGCLYVLEGSALGGRIVAGMVRAALGAVPTAFLTGQGRAHQWPAVRGALRRFESQGGEGDAVVDGALSTFELFARHLAAPVPAR